MSIARFHHLLAAPDHPWRIERVLDFPGAFVLSDRHPVRFGVLLDVADNDGQPGLPDLDDVLCAREP